MTAIANSTKEVVVAKGANGRDEFSCPDCQQPVYPRHRAKWTDHFVHKPNSACKTKLVVSLESDEHKLGKQLIVEWLKNNRDSSVEIVTEKIVRTADGQCRKIDVAVIKNGRIVEAHECQLSPICVNTERDGLLDRTVDYHRLGISVTWWLGREADSLTILEFFETIRPGLSKNGIKSIISEPFHLWAYPIHYPNVTIFEMGKNREKTTMNNTKLEKKISSNDDTPLVVSKIIARFLNSVRSQLATEEIQELDKCVLECCNDIGVWNDGRNIEKARREVLNTIVSFYSQQFFGYEEIDEDKDKVTFDLIERVSDLITNFGSKAILKNVVELASSCFEGLKSAPEDIEVVPAEWFKRNETSDEISLVSFKSKTSTNTIESLFKYGNPQTARTFIKEAIANALDQNPADATALCAAWEQIQPTLPAVEKDVSPAPIWVKQVAEESLPISMNGNGRH